MTPYYEHAGITIYHADCRDVLPHLPKVDLVLTDPPYGVGLEAKRAKMRGGGVTVRDGSYSFDDTPEYVRDVVIPIIEQCMNMARRVVLERWNTSIISGHAAYASERWHARSSSYANVALMRTAGDASSAACPRKARPLLYAISARVPDAMRKI